MTKVRSSSIHQALAGQLIINQALSPEGHVLAGAWKFIEKAEAMGVW